MAEAAEKIVPLPSGKAEYVVHLQPLMGFMLEKIAFAAKDSTGKAIPGEKREMLKLNLMGGSVFLSEVAPGIEPGAYRRGKLTFEFRSGKNGGEFRPHTLLEASR